MANMLSWLTGREDKTQDPWPFQPQAELRAYNPTPSERVGSWIQDLLMAGGAKAYPAGHVAHGVRDLLSMSPLGIGMSAADLLHAKNANDPMGAAAAAIGMVPGLKPEVTAVRQGIRAYHGSPHDFDKFDIKRIGTGEGAQTYGHGLYFAENEGVAKDYRDKLSGNLPRSSNKIGESPIYPTELKGKMYEVNINAKPEQFLDWDKHFGQQSPDVSKILKDMGVPRHEYGPKTGREIYKWLGDSPSYNYQMGAKEIQKATGAFLEAGIPGIRYLDQGSRPVQKIGNPLPQDVLDALKQVGYLGFDRPGQAMAAIRSDVTAGKDIRKSWDMGRQEDAGAAKLLEDYARRPLVETPPQQTSNYVLFNDQLVDIMRKYGLAAPAAAGAASYAMQPQEAQAAKAQSAQVQQPAPLSDRINQIIDSLQWQDQWQGRMRLPLQNKVNSMLGESVWPPMP